MTGKATIVIDIGKTMSKLSLWASNGACLARRSRPNNPNCRSQYFSDLNQTPIACLDVAGIERWVKTILAEFATMTEIGSIIPVAHGAGLAVIKNGMLVCEPLDYETTPPANIMTAYRERRDDFANTGSPALADGLNAGLQLFWMETMSPDILNNATIMPWAQYWAWWLSGQARSEVTSLGCHTDLWNPTEQDFSALAKRKNWADKLAPLAKAGDVVGQVRPNLQRETGLAATVNIHCGLHDSNAALVAARGFVQVRDQEASIVSTGTWFIAMRSPQSGFDTASLPQGRDCLVNVDVDGNMVPSARFMGGREIQTLIENSDHRIDQADTQSAIMDALPIVLSHAVHITPSFANEYGPFQNHVGQWVNMTNIDDQDGTIKQAAICLYVALMVDTCLDLIGAKNHIIVEGRFAKADVFVRALSSLRTNDNIFITPDQTDVSFGALRLIYPSLSQAEALVAVEPLPYSLDAYRQTWRENLAPARFDKVTA